MNKADNDFVAWNFAAAEGFFDVVTYEGDGSYPNGLKVPHSLGVEPGMIIVKGYSVNPGESSEANTNWAVWHKDLSQNNLLKLNLPNAEASSEDLKGPHTKDHFEVYAHTGFANQPGANYVAYLFADNPDEGIKCGRLT